MSHRHSVISDGAWQTPDLALCAAAAGMAAATVWTYMTMVVFYFTFQLAIRILSPGWFKTRCHPKNTCLTGIMTWVGLCMPKLKKDVISWCNNGNNTSAKRPGMRVKKASGQHNPNSNDLKRATRATFKQRISLLELLLLVPKDRYVMHHSLVYHSLASPYNVNNT